MKKLYSATRFKISISKKSLLSLLIYFKEKSSELDRCVYASIIPTAFYFL
ncbi:MAG: hypothetical protein ACRC0V_04405 [Fusobacteriaceae bacterium]